MQDDEVSKLASQLIPGYPAQPTGGNPLYAQDLVPLDGDMSQYIHDNTEDELSHEVFINKYLASKGAPTVDLDQFRTLPSSKATGANQFRAAHKLDAADRRYLLVDALPKPRKPRSGRYISASHSHISRWAAPGNSPDGQGYGRSQLLAGNRKHSWLSFCFHRARRFQSLSSVGTTGSPVWRFCASFSVLAEWKSRISRHGTIKQAMRRNQPMSSIP